MKRSLLFVLISILSFGISEAQITSVGLIGSATPGGWDADTNMVQDADSAHIWTISITLTDGAAKFRADDEWTVNWGSDTYPVGVGTQDGSDIPVIAGDYLITFNSNTGDYYFEYDSPIGIIGSATPNYWTNEWDSDINLIPDTSAAQDTDIFFVTLDLKAGAAKFRADDDWAVNWGSSVFPLGTGTQNGDDIPIPQSGSYDITFNRSTGVYFFLENVTYTTVGIIGDATEGGWDMPTAMTKDPDDGNVWTLSAQLGDGGLQFSGDDGEVIWGGVDFPEGTATFTGDTIPVTSGKYLIRLNTKTGQYSFTRITIYETMGIIGTASPLQNWDEDVDMARSATDSSVWTLRTDLFDGELKFRANNNWDVNWGGTDFPIGTASLGSFTNIPITAGEYFITFNSFTLEYSFQELVIYDTVGIVGNASPTASWDDDTYMEKSADDENIWTLQSATFFDRNNNDQEDGGVKFRVNSAWDVNWGADSWPSGMGTQEGANIPTVAGTYGVTLNSATGEYAFGDPLTSTEDLLKPSQIEVFPNPATNVLNVDFTDVQVKGTLTFQVFDMKGQLLLTQQQAAAKQIKLSVSSLPTGNYTLQVLGDNMIVGKRFAIVE